MSGWIKIHRKISQKAFYSKDSEKVHLWFHLLIKANREEREEIFNGKPIICKPGQFTTGRKQLSMETGIPESKIQRILSYFEKIEQQIEQQTSSTNRLISINNWKEYQISEQQIEQRVNNNRTTSEQRVNTLQEDKEVKNYKNTLLSDLKKSDVPNHEYFDITISFWELFKNNLMELEIKTTTLDKAKGIWIDQIRLLIEVDKFNIEDTREVFRFLQENQFWKKNILSTSKLRKQFEKLLIESRSNEKNRSNNQTGASTREVAEIIGKHFANDSKE